MGVMRPHACGMSEAEALALVETVREETGAFVQVVNFNVRGRQYSVTGDRRALDTLAERLNRGAGDRPAWVLVPGIDVPFHSSLLRSGVDRFRATMEASFPTQMAWRELVGRYVPNLVARPFELTEDFLRATLEACGSQRIAALLEQPLMADDATARIVLIELLAWQFASPVRWIETQELLLSRVERFVEVGVAHQPTVANMMRSTLKTLPAVHEPPAIFNAEADFDALLGPVVPYEQDALPQEASDGGAPEDESASGQAIAAAPVVARAPTSIPAGGDSIADIAVSPADALRTIVALHGRLRLDQITDTETLDELLGGNSARRNQVMADLGAELGPAGLDGAHELPLGTVAAAMTARAGYSGHGGYLAEAIDATLQRGVGAARLSRAVLSEYLTDEWCLGTGHVFQVVNRVALGARQGKATRGGELSALPADLVADRSTGLAWVDTVVSAYGQERGVALSKAAVVTPEGGAVVDSAALAALTAEIEARLTQTAEALAGSASGQSLPAPEVDEKAERLARYEAEHDQAYLDLIRPCFDPQKHLALTSAWAWIRRDAAEQTLTGQPATCDRTGSDFAGRTFVVTGAGPGSIALAMVKTLLAQGARVVLTTSRYRRERFKSYSAMYRNTAAHGAELHVVPCNQGSFEDVDAFCAWLSARWRPDTLVPFGAIGEAADLAGMGPRSLASLRVLMLGVERLVARIAEGLAVRPGAPAVALLPLSPNHGIFGGDGAYAEAKAGLETLLNKWHHEAWGRQIVVVGAQIGWVRGTGLMAHNDDVAQHLDGITTFAQSEMAAALLALVESKPVQGEVPAPTCADLTGGLKDAGSELATTVATVRAQAQKARATEQRRLVLEQALSGATEPVESPATTIAPAPVSRVDAPIPTAAELESFRPLGHLDLDRIVTIVGYGEVGPWGSHRTRWAAEQGLQLGLESVAELAWTMGLIRPAVKGAGWVDAASGEAVADKDLGERYEARVMENCGIRVVDPDLQGFDPRSALQYSDVHLEQDFAFEVNSREEAEAFREADPEHTEVVAREDGTLLVRRLAGTTIKVRRSLHLDRWAGGQVPSGWDATRFGISPEIVEQVDRVTLFLLVATAEAFLQAGLEPEEIYAFLHPTRVACTQASGIGGMRKQRRLNQDFELGNERQSDVLQETLINVISGWVVQSYLGSYGEMRFPVGACATASVSLAEGVDAIVGNKADMVVTGAVDDWTLEGQVGFADMGATASTQAMADKGIGPRELCRPNDRRRGGFVEAQGAGAMILCRASLALRAGLPVYGVVAYAATYGDGINRSVPAPGVGILGCMAERREAPWDPTSACDFEERRGAVLEAEQSQSAFEAAVGVERAERIVAQSRAHYGHDFWRGREDVAPLRGALAVLGLGADDIAFVSKHDTSTAANDPNEATLHDELQRRLGRSDKRPLMVVSQKSLTGHSKGSAAAWQLNGALQVMASGVIPGNLQLEDVDDYGQSLEHLCFTDRAIAAPRQDLKAALVTSLGFGHIGAIVALAHPFCFWSALSEADRASYQARIEKRLNGATRKLRGVLTGRQPLLTLRTERPFEGGVGSDEHRAHETEVLTDAGARRPVGAASFVRLVSSP
ncbi:MAG: fatty acid synthase [Myxococcota bacterium]|jgi:fatty acid synthase